MTISEILELLAQRQPLSDEQADFMFTKLMDGDMTEAQTGAFLMGLRAKGEDSTDLAAGVRAGLAHANKIPGFDGNRSEPVVDTCGTGGDGQCSFNNSTAVSLFLADMGYTVAKHGNRALSSSCGSADALEALGIPLNQTPDEAAAGLARYNFAFLFAPAYHPAFKHVMPVRQQLGIRTLFNFMGPLLNPARPSHQLMGVGDPTKLELMGETLLLTGVKRALIFAGAGGFDELTTWGVNRGYVIRDGIMEKTTVNGELLGFAKHDPKDVMVSGKDDAVAKLKDILAGKGPRAMMDMAALNLAGCLHLLGKGCMADCADMARDVVNTGLTKGIPYVG
ncbi:MULTISPECIES: anthranilate phosphoribosyltransferase [unclassified Pseudodesulfovibrio]|uniref:anthranilate phosphoribosyltransferase n=1 Tax=unclassified Pseudodesulfovibrio TaxID=2661612 RepID=UPI000FEB5E0C|nr:MULTISPECIES: anthranilate phosphoribosyltransferase [unclassified Pseudodesulfovibrio]MCJ2164592.1 anthranilate phosphoribosyltransferase [Pseudodesulfovibrio sp. S3-i]RWU04213.1 anthranilate phosphoribosyltransferase [Pseudodesulfovibrio sp. S3]